MPWKEWWESRKTIPKYIVNCTCDKNSSQNSLLDEWSFVHIAAGILYSIPLFFLDSNLVCFLINIASSITWELFENSYYGTRCTSWWSKMPTYTGDNIWNSVFDVICGTIGFLIMLLIRINIHE